MAHAFPANPKRRNKRRYKQSKYWGELHIDKDEEWTFSSQDVSNSSDNLHVMYTLIHELGHVLGLDHVDNPDSIMYWKSPSSIFKMNHKVDVNFPDLNEYDIAFISRLYGRRNPSDEDENSVYDLKIQKDKIELPKSELYRYQEVDDYENLKRSLSSPTFLAVSSAYSKISKKRG